ncbi:MAG: hypothetical protein V4696_00670 [Pseudomonadota bacterium]
MMATVRNGTAVKWRDQTIVTLLEKLNRHRELEPEERVLMDRTIRRITPKRDVWRWSEKEDRLLLAFMKRRTRAGRPKPFQPNDEVRNLAEELGRSYFAVHRRIERLRKAGKCSDAAKRAKR